MGLEPTTFCMANGSWVQALLTRKPVWLCGLRGHVGTGGGLLRSWSFPGDSVGFGHWKSF